MGELKLSSDDEELPVKYCQINESSHKHKICRIFSSSEDDRKDDSHSKKERKDHPTKHMNIKKDKNVFERKVLSS